MTIDELALNAIKCGWTDIHWSKPSHRMADGSAPWRQGDNLPDGAYLIGHRPGTPDWRDPKTGLGSYQAEQITESKVRE